MIEQVGALASIDLGSGLVSHLKTAAETCCKLDGSPIRSDLLAFTRKRHSFACSDFIWSNGRWEFRK